MFKRYDRLLNILNNFDNHVNLKLSIKLFEHNKNL